jgi:predicted nucleic acid-binding protein
LLIIREKGITEIYSNDKDFDKIGWVKRIWE